eukprot:TRINITY_DN45015_c0_g1_i2.p1 TRINITY_DN45015_c0_g1~~TRINITY_DN45015_c0_g1_i2.p1  ORF type:complete len:572 (+),score=64.34 TRINITY_DN45015_c0_g1_i2:569-2284(+)
MQASAAVTIGGHDWEDVGGLLCHLLTPKQVNAGFSWLFVGPRGPWRQSGFTSGSLQSLERHGCREACLVEAARRTGDEDLDPPPFRAGIEAKGRDSRAATAEQIVSKWGLGGDAAAIERIVRAGGSAILALRGVQLDNWLAKGSLPKVGSVPGYVSGPRTRNAVEVLVDSKALGLHIAAVLSSDLRLIEDVTLTPRSFLRRGWQLLPNASKSASGAAICCRRDFLDADLPLTLSFEPDPGLTVVAAAPHSIPLPGLAQLQGGAWDEESERRLSSTRRFGRKVRWPPDAGLRVRRSAALDEACGTIICAAGEEAHALVRWDGEDDYETVHVGALEVVTDTDEFVSKVRKFRTARSEEELAATLGSSPTRSKNSSLRRRSTAEEIPDLLEWRFFVASGFVPEGDACAGHVGDNGSIRLWELSGGCPMEVKAPISVPSAVLWRCAQMPDPGVDAPATPTALLIFPAALMVSEIGLAIPPQCAAEPLKGWLRVGSVVLVDAAALPGYGPLQRLHGGPHRRAHFLPWEHRRLPRSKVRACVVALAGHRQVGVQLLDAQDDSILWLPGSHVHPAGAL